MIVYHLTRLSDGRVMFAPVAGPSHTFPDATAARWFIKGWHYHAHPSAPAPEFRTEIE